MSTYSIYPRQFNNSDLRVQSDTCFVIMPFSDVLSNTYLVIDSVASTMNIKCTRADKVSTTSEPILSKICTQISQAYFIIVDITDLNPNVFYELGIAHVLRDANKVLIIKDEATVCPSDIRHLHYYAYSRSNLKGLKETIEKFFAENNILEDLQSVLSFLDLLPHGDTAHIHKFVVGLSNCIGNNIDVLIMILNNKVKKSFRTQIVDLLKALTQALNSMNHTDEMYLTYSNLILMLVSKVHGVCDISEYIHMIFNGQFDNLSEDWLADCSVTVLDDTTYFDESITWIMEYLKDVSPAAFDVAKYKLEIGIIRSKSELVDAILVKELKSSNKTLAEHCAKIVKERKTYEAIPTLIEIVETEENPYVFRSCLDALIGMAPLKALFSIQRKLSDRKEFLDTHSFLSKHLEDLKNQIEKLQNTTNK